LPGLRNIFSVLRTNLEYYSDVEKKIAHCILLDPNQFITYSMAELSESIGVSQGSINNFSQKVSGGGFAALKLQIASQLPAFEPVHFSTVTDDDEAMDVLSKTIDQANLAFRNTFELNSAESMKKAADMILCAKRIEIYGIFLSGIVANSFYYQLLQLGLSAAFVSDVLLSPVSASMLDSSGLVIAVSSSGKTKDIIDAVKIAKSNDVPILTITSNKNSPLAKLSDAVLYTASSGAAISNSMYETQMSQTLIVDALCSYIRHRLDKDGNKQYFKLDDILNSHNVND